MEVHDGYYTTDFKKQFGCHGLVPWRFTLVTRVNTTRRARGIVQVLCTIDSNFVETLRVH